MSPQTGGIDCQYFIRACLVLLKKDLMSLKTIQLFPKKLSDPWQNKTGDYALPNQPGSPHAGLGNLSMTRTPV